MDDVSDSSDDIIAHRLLDLGGLHELDEIFNLFMQPNHAPEVTFGLPGDARPMTRKGKKLSVVHFERAMVIHVEGGILNQGAAKEQMVTLQKCDVIFLKFFFGILEQTNR